jgi:hypothetical protein
LADYLYVNWEVGRVYTLAIPRTFWSVAPPAVGEPELNVEKFTQNRWRFFEEFKISFLASLIATARFGNRLGWPVPERVLVLDYERRGGSLHPREAMDCEAMIGMQPLAGNGGDCCTITVDADPWYAVLHGHNQNAREGLVYGFFENLRRLRDFERINAVAMGPGICGGCYEFGRDHAFYTLPPNYRGPLNRFILPHADRSKVYLNLPEVFAYQFERLGVRPSRILRPPDCTYHGPGCFYPHIPHRRFYSARRGEKGRFLTLAIPDRFIGRELGGRLLSDEALQGAISYTGALVAT